MATARRRTVTKGAVWAAPVAALPSVTAPAYAVSQGCVEGQALITTTSTPITTLGFQPSDVTATVTYSSTTYPGGTAPAPNGQGFRVFGPQPPVWEILLFHVATAAV